MAEQRFPFRRIDEAAATERTSRRAKRVIKHCAPSEHNGAATKGGLLQPICERRPGEDPCQRITQPVAPVLPGVTVRAST